MGIPPTRPREKPEQGMPPQIDKLEHARQTSESRGVIHAMVDGVMIYDNSGCVQQANPAAVNLLGFDPTAWSLADAIRSLNARRWDGQPISVSHSPVARALRGETVTNERLILTNAQGQDFTILTSASPLFMNDRLVGVVNVFQDFSEREHLMRQLQDQAAELAGRTRELTSLLEISRSFASILDLDPLLALVLGQLQVIINCTGAAIFVPDGDDIVMLGYRGSVSQDQVRGFRAPLCESPLYQKVVQQKEPVIISDLANDTPLSAAYRQLAATEVKYTLDGARSVMGVPLLVAGRLIGMLRLDRAEPHFFTPRHAEFALAIAQHAAAAIENARLYENKQRIVALEERQRLARELHDSVSQSLYGIVLGVHAARKMPTDDRDRIRDTLDYVLTQAETALTEMRALIFELRPETLAREGLVTALDRQAAAIRLRYCIDLTTELGVEPDIPLDMKGELYRIGQEALRNAAKHAKATHLSLRLYSGPDEIGLEVIDDGIGFDPSTPFPGHLGLESMRERAARRNGRLEVMSAPGRGTRICVRFLLSSTVLAPRPL